MKTQNDDSKRNDELSAKQNDAGKTNSPNNDSGVNEGQRRSEKDPQNTSMGHGSQPASVSLNRGEGDQEKTNPTSANTDKKERGDKSNSPGYGASNNVAGA